MYVARTEWGMSARELWTETPEWEVIALLDEREQRQRDAQKAAEKAAREAQG